MIPSDQRARHVRGSVVVDVGETYRLQMPVNVGEQRVIRAQVSLCSRGARRRLLPTYDVVVGPKSYAAATPSDATPARGSYFAFFGRSMAAGVAGLWSCSGRRARLRPAVNWLPARCDQKASRKERVSNDRHRKLPSQACASSNLCFKRFRSFALPLPNGSPSPQGDTLPLAVWKLSHMVSRSKRSGAIMSLGDFYTTRRQDFAEGGHLFMYVSSVSWK